MSLVGLRLTLGSSLEKDILNYGVKYFDKAMTPNKVEMDATCLCKKEKTPGTTTT